MSPRKKRQKTTPALRVPQAIFRARGVTQHGWEYDQQGQYGQAVTYYLRAVEMYTTQLKKHPKIPFRKLWAQECRLHLNRIHQLKPHITNGSVLVNSPDSPERSTLSRDDEQYAEMAARIHACRIDPDPNLSAGDVVGLEQVKIELREVLELPLEFPGLLQRNVPGVPRAVLLFGPPRCGKTFIVRAVASELGLPIFAVTPGILYQKWMGESQKMVEVLYKKAWEAAPSIIFIDEFDKIFGKPPDERTGRGGTEASLTGMQVQGEFLQYLSGMKAPAENHTVTIAATNFPWHLEQQMVTRFDRVLYVHPPYPSETERLIERNLAFFPHSLVPDHYKWLAHEVEMYTPAEINKICFRAGQLAIQKAKKTPGRLLHVGIRDIREAIRFSKPLLELRGVKGIGTRWFREWNERWGAPIIEYYKSAWETHPYVKDNPIHLDRWDNPIRRKYLPLRRRG